MRALPVFWVDVFAVWMKKAGEWQCRMRTPTHAPTPSAGSQERCHPLTLGGKVYIDTVFKTRRYINYCLYIYYV